MKVTVERHNPIWLTRFQTANAKLLSILKTTPIVSIEHVGSTSIPDLPAKPVLDIDIIVTSLNVERARNALVAAGYTDLGDLGIQDRYAMREPGYEAHEFAHGEAKERGEAEEGLGMRMNTYVVLEGCLQLKNHLDVRRVLLENEGLRTEYGNVKWALVGKDGGEGVGIEEYVRGKNKIVLKILEEAGWGERELKVVRKSNS